MRMISLGRFATVLGTIAAGAAPTPWWPVFVTLGLAGFALATFWEESPSLLRLRSARTVDPSLDAAQAEVEQELLHDLTIREFDERLRAAQDMRPEQRRLTEDYECTHPKCMSCGKTRWLPGIRA